MSIKYDKCCQLAGKNEENLKSMSVSQADEDEDEGKRAWARAFLHAATMQRDRMRAKKAAAEKMA